MPYGTVPELEVAVDVAGGPLGGTILLPPGARGLVVFAHGSGSSRFSPRNRFVARVLQLGGLGTLLVDLLTAEEEERDRLTGELRFDIGHLARRLADITEWLGGRRETARLRIGYFGASTGAAAALRAAAALPSRVGAVVSRGGRPDLAGEMLPDVQAPTLLVVGGADLPVLDLNRAAAERLRCPHALEVIPGATHLFEEPGALEEVARLARSWFATWLAPNAPTLV